MRHAALTGLAALDRHRAARERTLSRPRIHFLYLHHLFPDEERSFRALIELLIQSHKFLSYSEAVERADRGPIDRPYICLSFDDGFATCHRAARILAEYEVCACFFLVTSMVGERDPERIATFCHQRLNRPPLDFLDWNRVDDLLAWGHEIGSHTANHIDLGRAIDSDLRRELVTSREVLERHVGEVHHLSWPYGRLQHFSAAAALAAKQAGYVSCASGERGAHVSASVQEGPLFVWREHVCAAWPLRHNLFFISRSARSAEAANSEWPPVLWPEREHQTPGAGE